MTGITFSQRITSSVTLGVGGYTNPLTVARSGDVVECH